MFVFCFYKSKKSVDFFIPLSQTHCLEQYLFVAFCIEEYGAAKGLTGGQVLDLFSQYGVIDYLSKCYEPLHTQGRRWLMDEIDEFIAIRKNKKA